MNSMNKQLTLTQSVAVPKRKRSSRFTRADWLVVAGLLLLSAVPIVAGAARVTELASSAKITPDNARFFGSPVPVVVHISSVTLFALLGAFQFVPELRRRGATWHRRVGRVLVPFGTAAALSGLWMTLFYPLPAYDVGLLTVIRLVFGSGMVLSLILGFAAILRRDVAQHRAWMIRAYAIGMGAGTQVFTHVPYLILIGQPDKLPRALLMLAGWVINLAVAEWVIYRNRSLSRQRQEARHTGRAFINRLWVDPETETE